MIARPGGIALADLMDAVRPSITRTILAYRGLAGHYLDMRILIAGDRHWRCDQLVEHVVNRPLARYGPDLVIFHGGSPGVDQSFAVACRELGVIAEPYVADWRGLANIAGPATTGRWSRG